MTRKTATRRDLVPFSLEHFQDWSTRLVLDSGDNVRLEPFQLGFVGDVFLGKPVNWLVVPEGNGKTTLLAALGLYGLRFAEEASIPIAASSRDQARIMYRQMKGFVKRSGLGQVEEGLWFEAYDGYREIHLRTFGETRRGDVAGRIEIHAADAGTADGVIPFPFAFIDELHRHRDLSLQRTWVGKLGKRGAQLIGISTAGEPGSDFEVTREKMCATGDVETDGALTRAVGDRHVIHDYRVPVERILEVAAVKAANPLSTITVKSLEAKLSDPTMTERHWRRFTCNVATMDDGREPFIDERDWDDLADRGAVIAEGASVCIGADGSRSWDTTVVAWATSDDDGVVTVDARVFSVRPDVGCHVLHQGGKIDFDDVESFLLDRFDLFDVETAAYDPRYLERSMEAIHSRLPDRMVSPVEPSSKAMRDALQAMFNLAAEKKLRHNGDPVLKAHVVNAGVDRGFGSEIRRVTKIDGRLPIDAVPAMALAVWKASQREQTVYRDRGLVVI